MMSRNEYTPGPADATIGQKDGDYWTLVLVRELRHSPEKVWRALTDPEQLREWSPFDADKNLGAVGPVRLTTVGAPEDFGAASVVTRAEEPRLLEYQWGGRDVRWELEALGQGTRLTLWASIDRRFIAMGAAGWHLCVDVMDQMLAGEPLGRIVAGDALQNEGWQRLNAEYSQRFGVEAPSW
jgi:uncharacterized protein YndB with AHSA1/START domain